VSALRLWAEARGMDTHLPHSFHLTHACVTVTFGIQRVALVIFDDFVFFFNWCNVISSTQTGLRLQIARWLVHHKLWSNVPIFASDCNYPCSIVGRTMAERKRKMKLSDRKLQLQRSEVQRHSSKPQARNHRQDREKTDLGFNIPVGRYECTNVAINSLTMLIISL